MLPSSQTIASRSTSGSTVIPISALQALILSDKSIRCSGRGSGLCGKWPLGSQYRQVMLLIPNALSRAGTKIPPVEFTASTTMLKFALEMMLLSTRGRARTASMCFCRYVLSVVIVPRSSTSANSNASLSAIDNTSSPSLPEMNSPFSLSNFRAFHCFGLWLAVRIIPPLAFSIGTAISTVGVVDSPRSITSIPKPQRVEVTKLEIISPEIRASRPITTLIFPVFLSFNQLP